MSKVKEVAPATGDVAPKNKKSKLLLAAPVVLVLLVAGLWFSGILPPLLGMGEKPAAKTDEAAAGKPAVPVFVDLPELVANLESGTRRQSYVKLRAKVELARAEDVPAVTAAMPRLQDMFNTYLRQMRPEELLGRANVAVAPIRVTDVLFIEMLIQ